MADLRKFTKALLRLSDEGKERFIHDRSIELESLPKQDLEAILESMPGVDESIAIVLTPDKKTRKSYRSRSFIDEMVEEMRAGTQQDTNRIGDVLQSARDSGEYAYAFDKLLSVHSAEEIYRDYDVHTFFLHGKEQVQEVFIAAIEKREDWDGLVGYLWNSNRELEALKAIKEHETEMMDPGLCLKAIYAICSDDDENQQLAHLFYELFHDDLPYTSVMGLLESGLDEHGLEKAVELGIRNQIGEFIPGEDYCYSRIIRLSFDEIWKKGLGKEASEYYGRYSRELNKEDEKHVSTVILDYYRAQKNYNLYSDIKSKYQLWDDDDIQMFLEENMSFQAAHVAYSIGQYRRNIEILQDIEEGHQYTAEQKKNARKKIDNSHNAFYSKAIYFHQDYDTDEDRREVAEMALQFFTDPQNQDRVKACLLYQFLGDQANSTLSANDWLNESTRYDPEEIKEIKKAGFEAIAIEAASRQYLYFESIGDIRMALFTAEIMKDKERIEIYQTIDEGPNSA